ncbi:MAG: FtsX-like permease family protein [Acidobacteria bacterium]|nr:FtsX-like permease family protein [Acidobacteriota bacterium]
MLWHIAWRNVWRNKVRSLVIASAIAIGLLGGVFSYAFMMGLVNQAVRSAIHVGLGSFQVHHPDYPTDRDLRYALDDVDALLAEVRSTPGVVGASSRIVGTAMASSAVGTAAARIVGVDLDHDPEISDLRTKLIEGAYLSADERIPLLMSEKVADDLEVRLRSRIVASVVSPTGEIVYGAFRIVGIFRTSDSVFDQSNVFVTREDLAELTGFADNSASELIVRIEPRESGDAVAAAFAAAHPELLVRTWRDLAPQLQLAADFGGVFGFGFLAIILTALGFGIVNTMLMVVMERTREIGMLMALGMARARVFWMLLYETAFLSMVGGVGGLVLSVALLGWLGRVGVNMQAWAEGLAAFGYDSMIYPEASTSFYLQVAGMVLVTAFLASIYPARRALKLLPAEAIRADT